MPRVALAMEACDDHNPVLLNLTKYSVGEAPHSRAATVPVDGRELHWMFCDCLYCRFDCQREPRANLVTNIVITSPGFQQIFVCFGYPDNRQRRHGFLNRLALTRSQG